MAQRIVTLAAVMRFRLPLLLLFPCLNVALIFSAAGQPATGTNATAAAAGDQARPRTNAITTEDVIIAEKLFGLDLPEDKLQMMLPGLRAQLRDYAVIRKIGVSNSV